jgi:hypothetical protein
MKLLIMLFASFSIIAMLSLWVISPARGENVVTEFVPAAWLSGAVDVDELRVTFSTSRAHTASLDKNGQH